LGANANACDGGGLAIAKTAPNLLLLLLIEAKLRGLLNLGRGDGSRVEQLAHPLGRGRRREVAWKGRRISWDLLRLNLFFSIFLGKFLFITRRKSGHSNLHLCSNVIVITVTTRNLPA
jgi:hypothetical protein